MLAITRLSNLFSSLAQWKWLAVLYILRRSNPWIWRVLLLGFYKRKNDHHRATCVRDNRAEQVVFRFSAIEKAGCFIDSQEIQRVCLIDVFAPQLKLKKTSK